MLTWSARGSFVAGSNSSQMASRFNLRSPSIHCSGTERLPPPSRYFAANPHPRKIVTKRTSRRNAQRPTPNTEYRIQKRLSALDIGCWTLSVGRLHPSGEEAEETPNVQHRT